MGVREKLIPLPCPYAVGDIMDTRTESGRNRFLQTHLTFPEEHKTIRIVPVLPEHTVTRAIRLVLNNYQWLVQYQ